MSQRSSDDLTDARENTLLREGDTCWRIAKADRVAFIVDAAAYFAAAKAAILKAEKAVYLIGWEFDLDLRLRPADPDPDTPDKLRQFLVHVAKQRPELEIFILEWDGALLINIARQIGSFLLLKTQAKPQIHFRLDSEHPIGASHHQKIVVIDDVLAFCGGIDMTEGRWDTPKHCPNDDRRLTDGTFPMPWHDVTTALDGEAARSLGELARWRWKRATGAELPVPDRQNDVWPVELAADCRDVRVGIARTMPRFGEEAGESEVERLWTAAISAARHTIYIENQFFSSGAIAETLARRLQEKDGPEVVLVLPFTAESWLESEVMDSARSLLISDLRRADHENRFAVYHPVNAAGEHIYVHAKVLIVDDGFIRVGSSNISCRSMSFDTECDLALEADDEATRSAISRLRDGLLAEHLGSSLEDFSETLRKADGSLLQTIGKLRSETGPTLCHLETRLLSEAEIALARSRLLDPEGKRRPSKRLAGFLARAVRRYGIPLAIAGTLLAGWAVHRLKRNARH